MTLVVRIYSSQKKAGDAAKKVKAEGYGDESVLVMTPPAAEAQTDVSAEVAAAVKAERLPKNYADVAADSLRQGRSIVSVNAYFGKSLAVMKMMDSFDPIKIEEPAPSKDAAKTKDWHVSDAWGIPLLWNGKSWLANLFGGELASSHFTFFGTPKLKKEAAPLSSCVGMETLSDNPTPLSSQFNMRLLSELDKDRTHSYGQPLLSSNPTPLSSKLGMKILSEQKKDWTESYGQPLLSSEPAPLSKALNIPVLTEDK